MLSVNTSQMSIQNSYNSENKTRFRNSFSNLLTDVYNLKNISYDRPEIELKHESNNDNIYKQGPKLRSQSEPQTSMSRHLIKQMNQLRLQQMREKIDSPQNQIFKQQYSQHIDNTQVYRYRILKDIKQKIDDNDIEYREINQFLEQIQRMPIPNNEKMMYLNQIESMLYQYEQKPSQSSLNIEDKFVSNNNQQNIHSIPVDMHIQSVESIPAKQSPASWSQSSKPKPRVQFQIPQETQQTLPESSSKLFKSSQLGYGKKSYNSDQSSDYEEIIQQDQQSDIRSSIPSRSFQKSQEKTDVLSNYSKLMEASISTQNRSNSQKQHGNLQNDLISQLCIYKTDQQQKQLDYNELINQKRIDDKMEYLEQIDEKLNNSIKKNKERQNQIDRILASLQNNKQNLQKRKNQDFNFQFEINKSPEEKIQKQEVKEEQIEVPKYEVEELQPKKQDIPIKQVPIENKVTINIASPKLDQSDKQTQAEVQSEDKQTQCFIVKQQLFEPRKLGTIEECVQTEMNMNLLSSNIYQPKQIPSNLFMSQSSVNHPLQNSVFTQNNYEESLSSFMREEQAKYEQQSISEQISKSVIQQQSQQLQQKKLKDQINAELKMQELKENLHEQSFVTKQEEEKTQKLKQFQNQMLQQKQNLYKNNPIMLKKQQQTAKNLVQMSQLKKQSPSLQTSEQKVQTRFQSNVKVQSTAPKITQYAVPSKPFQPKASQSPRVPEKPQRQVQTQDTKQNQIKKPVSTIQKQQPQNTQVQPKKAVTKPQAELKSEKKPESKFEQKPQQKPVPQQKQISQQKPISQQNTQTKTNQQVQAQKSPKIAEINTKSTPNHVDINLQLISSDFTPKQHQKFKIQPNSLQNSTISQRKSNVFTKNQISTSPHHSLPPPKVVSTPQEVMWQSGVSSQKKRVATLVFE